MSDKKYVKCEICKKKLLLSSGDFILYGWEQYLCSIKCYNKLKDKTK